MIKVLAGWDGERDGKIVFAKTRSFSRVRDITYYNNNIARAYTRLVARRRVVQLDERFLINLPSKRKKKNYFFFLFLSPSLWEWTRHYYALRIYNAVCIYAYTIYIKCCRSE